MYKDAKYESSRKSYGQTTEVDCLTQRKKEEVSGRLKMERGPLSVEEALNGTDRRGGIELFSHWALSRMR